MEQFVVEKASEIELPSRQWIERLFGRSLAQDEYVTIFVASPQETSAVETRQAAFDRLRVILDKAATNMSDVPNAELNVAVDEAIEDAVRKRAT